MDASQYKDYVLFMLFIKYISDKYGDYDGFEPPVVIPKGASFKDMVALKGKSDIGEHDQHPGHPAAGRSQLRLARSDFPRLRRLQQTRRRPDQGRAARQPDRHLREPRARFLEEPRRER
jgi:hypothetical protein